jgi:hypothetical protein
MLYAVVQLKVEDVDAQTWRFCEGSLWEIDVTWSTWRDLGRLEQGKREWVSTADEA